MRREELAVPFVFFDHTGDIGVDLAARDAGTLFGEAARALTEAVTALESVRPVGTRTLHLQAEALDLLLVDWLGELLFAFESEGWLTAEADVRLVLEAGQWSLDATARGERLDPGRHGVRVLVKAITYHGLHVTKGQEGWTARVVLDI